MKPFASLRDLFSSTELAATVLLATAFLTPASAALTFPVAPSPNLDLSQLGRVAVLGDFAGASLFQYTQQSENVLRTNGSHSLLSRFPNNGAFAALQASDAYINAMCQLQSGGKLQGVVIGGNFTSLGGVNSPGIALFDPNTSTIQAIPGLSGTVKALFCDPSGTVYIGGMFSASNSTNAVSWTTTAGFKTLPFTGFNGQVTSITKDSNQNILFGGSFDGLGNTTTPDEQNSQRISLTSAKVTVSDSTQRTGLDSPANIVCKDPATTGPGATWLLQDGSKAGTLNVMFDYGFNPTLLRIKNTQFEGRGVKTWYFSAFPSNGIMNFTYVDQNGVKKACTNVCPLAAGNGNFTDYKFVNSVGMTGFTVTFTDFYGAGAGLDDIELYSNDIYAYAINSFNEPACPGVSFPSSSSSTGTWTNTTGIPGTTSYLSSQVSKSSNVNDTQVVFTPDIKQSGNYSVTIFTPGCIGDGTCTSRGRISVSGSLSSATSPSPAFQTDIFQTNNFDKYDQIFLGHIDASSSSFKPTITITPSAGQDGTITVVAQRVRFELMTSSGGLNGLFEFDPSSTTVDMNFRKSTVDSVGTALNTGAVVNALTTIDGSVYVGGRFQGNGVANFLQIGDDSRNVPNGGLNGAVSAVYQNGSGVYVGGAFNNTQDGKGPAGLSGIALLSTNNTWSALGAGVRGKVTYIVPFQISLSSSKNTDLALAVSGSFDQINAFGSFAATPVKNFAVWIPSRNGWLQNLNIPSVSLQGILTAQTDVQGNPPLFAGAVSSFDVTATGAVKITGATSLESFPVQIQSPKLVSGSNKRKRATTDATSRTGVLTGLFTTQNNKNFTVLGGHFTSGDISNLLIIDGQNSDKLSGLPSGIDTSSTFTSVGAVSNSLFAGGTLSGRINNNPVSGMVVYDLTTSQYTSPQPAALRGGNNGSVTVTAIAPQPNTQSVFVAGNFDGAGSFNCPSLCIYDASRQQWSAPAAGFNGSVTNLVWVDETRLLIAGDLTINGTKTTISLYDSKAQFFTAASSSGAPVGTISALTPANQNGSAAWIGGTGSDGAAFLAKYNGFTWSFVNGLGANTSISALQIFAVSKSHEENALVDKDHSLLVMGNLAIPAYGQAAAAVFNGTSLVPYLLAGTADGQPGTTNGIIASNPLNFFKAGKKHLAVGFVVLIALAIALGILFLLIAFGFLAGLIRRRRMGYRAAPTDTTTPSMSENLRRAPPEELLGRVGTQSGRGWSAR